MLTVVVVVVVAMIFHVAAQGTGTVPPEPSQSQETNELDAFFEVMREFGTLANKMKRPKKKKKKKKKNTDTWLQDVTQRSIVERMVNASNYIQTSSRAFIARATRSLCCGEPT